MLATPAKYYVKMKESLELIYSRGIESLKNNLPYYWDAYTIAKMWEDSLKGREAELDLITPFYMKLKLAPTDDICKEALLFLEEVEDEWGEFEQVDTCSKEVLLHFCNVNIKIDLFFTQNEQGICKIIELKRDEVVSKVIGRKVICY